MLAGMDERLSRANRKRLADREVDTLIGLAKGFVADGELSAAEAECLYGWLAQSQGVSDHRVIQHLYARMVAMMEDGVLDPEELRELLATLQALAGPATALGESRTAATLPLNDPQPPLQFEGRAFVFTGTCMFGTRKQCTEATRRLGGVVADRVTRSLNYLVIGSYVTDSWAHETFGRKIEAAMELRAAGLPLAIVSEAHWASHAGLALPSES
jgi:NAD-dependent DNA ligase